MQGSRRFRVIFDPLTHTYYETTIRNSVLLAAALRKLSNLNGIKTIDRCVKYARVTENRRQINVSDNGNNIFFFFFKNPSDYDIKRPG